MVNPYHDVQVTQNVFVREFLPDVEDSELVWHRDYKSRNITVLEGEGWKLQFDNELPVDLKEGESWFIESMKFHRLWRGNTKLQIQIRELD